MVGVGGETDDTELRKLREKVVTPGDGYLRRDKVNLSIHTYIDECVK